MIKFVVKVVWTVLAFSSVAYAFFPSNVGEALSVNPVTSLAQTDFVYAFMYENGATPYMIHTFKTVVWALFVTLPLLWVFQMVYSPMEYIRNVEDVGYLPEKEKSIKDVAQQTRHQRNPGKLPPAYPNGWYRLLDSSDIQVGDVRKVDCLGEHFAVFRGEDGNARILDAYCPHLGANLAAGGRVKGNCIECPFHGWKFDGRDGKCKDIPYADTVPDVAKTRVWHTLEINGNVLVWFDAEKRDPMWTPPKVEEIHNGLWSFRGRTTHTVNAHIQEIPENGADVAHLEYLHSPPIMNGVDLRNTHDSMWNNISSHVWNASWKAGEGDEKHIAFLDLLHNVRLFGWVVPMLEFKVYALQVGPGLVYLRWKSFFGEVPNIIAKFFLRGEAIQVERDIMIWNNKTFRSAPLLVKEDKLIPKFRRWYSQFYSENSRTVEKKEALDW
eukprot:Nk52_evm8s490 gene=Nk52_evmTU8s490